MQELIGDLQPSQQQTWDAHGSILAQEPSVLIICFALLSFKTSGDCSDMCLQSPLDRKKAFVCEACRHSKSHVHIMIYTCAHMPVHPHTHEGAHTCICTMQTHVRVHTTLMHSVNIHAHACDTQVLTCTHLHSHAHTHARTHMQTTCTQANAYTDAHMHAHAHTNAHTGSHDNMHVT